MDLLVILRVNISKQPSEMVFGIRCDYQADRNHIL